MSEICQALHDWVHQLPVFSFPFNPREISRNGVYFLFEDGEIGHGGRRIVRVGTHTGQNQLHSRLKQHFLNENKDRSIFRKNIGRCLLNQKSDPFLSQWELDLTSRRAKDLHGKWVDFTKQAAVEREVSLYIQEHFTLSFIEIAAKENRLFLESRLISAVSLCKDCASSQGWLGNSSPKERIKESGLWQVNELYKEPLSPDDLAKIVAIGM